MNWHFSITTFGWLVLLVGCNTPPPATDFVIVEPIRFVPQPPAPVPNMSFGWLPADMGNAEAFRVKLGNKQYFELLNQVGPERITTELALFAEREVVNRGACSSGVARTIRPQIVGPRSGEYVWLLVRCT